MHLTPRSDGDSTPPASPRWPSALSESPTPPTAHSPGADFRRLGLIAAGYAITLKLALFFPDAEGVMAAVWPPGGVALAALLLSPQRQRWAILATIFITGNVVNLLSGRPALASAGFMVANVLESWGCAWLFTRWCGPRVTFARVREVLALAACAAVVNSITALLGAAAALFADDAPFHDFYVSWWIADGLGILLVTPLIVVCAQPWRRLSDSWPHQLEAVALAVVWCACAYLGFRGAIDGLPLVPRPYWMLVPLVWVTLRFGTRPTAILLTLLAIIAVWITVTGRSEFPLGGSTPLKHLQSVQIFLGVITMTGLVLAATVAERKRTEQETRESEQRFRTIFEEATDGMLLTDSQTLGFIMANRSIQKLLDYSEAELLQLNAADIHPAADLASVVATVKKLAHREIAAAPPIPVRRKNGSVFYADFSATLLRLRDRDCVLATVRDITDRKLAEDRLRTSEESYRRQFANNSVVMLLLDPADGAIVDVNAAALAFYGYPRETLLAMRISDINTLPPAEVRRAMDSSVQNGKGHFEFPHRLADGSVRTVEASSTSLQIGDRLLLHVIIFDITARKQAESAVELARQHFQNLLETASDGIHILDPEGNLVQASPSFYRLLGYEPGDKAVRHVTDWDAQWSAVEMRVRIAALFERSAIFETRHRRRDGAILTVEIHARGIQIGGHTHLYASARDITARKHAEQQLKENEQRLAHAMDQAHLAYWEMDAATATFTFNDRFYALYGTTAAREGGYRMPAAVYAREFLPPEEQHIIAADVAKLLSGEIAVLHAEHCIVRRDGEIRHLAVRINVVRDARGQLLGTRGSNQDITESRRAADALRKSEELFRSVVASMAEGVVLQSADGAIVDCNAQAERILGMTREQLLGRTSVDPRWRAVREDGSPLPGEQHPGMVTLRTGQRCVDFVMGIHVPGHGLRWVNINSEPMFHPGSAQPYGVVATFADITERKAQHIKMRAMLEQAELDARTKSELLREVNHRVTNNLTSVLGLLVYERENLSGDDRVAIAQPLERLQQRIRGLLTLHRMLSQSAWAPVNLAVLAEKTIRPALSSAAWADQAVITIEPTAQRISPRQAGALAMIFNELATNTAKYASPDARRVTIDVGFQIDGDWATISYRDNGPGYATDVLENQRSNVGLRLIRESVATTFAGLLALTNAGGAQCTLRLQMEKETRT